MYKARARVGKKERAVCRKLNFVAVPHNYLGRS